MRKVLAGTLVVVALAFALAGCGGGGSSSTNSTQRNDTGLGAKSAKQVLAAAVKSTKEANTVRMNGDVNPSGQQVGLDVLYDKFEGAKGALTIDGKYPVQFIVIGKDGYLNANDPEFWTKFGGPSGAMIAENLDGRWLKFPVDNPLFAPLVAYASPKAILDHLKSDGNSDLKNNGNTTYNGQSAVSLDDGANRTLYVAASGIPYPVALVKTGKDGGTVSFTAWNQPFPLTAPTNAVDFSDISSG